MSLNTVTSCSNGRRQAPSGAIAELRELYEKIDLAAGELIDVIESIDAPEFEIGLASDDYEARSLGWPCVGAHAAAIGLAAAHVNRPIIVVPHGATSATAAAADMHDVALKNERA